MPDGAIPSPTAYCSFADHKLQKEHT